MSLTVNEISLEGMKETRKKIKGNRSNPGSKEANTKEDNKDLRLKRGTQLQSSGLGE